MSAPTNVKQVVRRYVELVAEYGPLAPRLRKLGRDGRDDVIDRATARVCCGLPHFIDSPDLWPFFEHSPRDGRTMLLVHHALDAARKEYIKQTSWSGGPALNPLAPKKFDLDAETKLTRHTEVGRASANEPTRMLERQEREAAEQRVHDTQAAETAAFLHDVEEWAATLPDKKWNVVWRLLWGFSYEQIRLATCNARGRMGASERIIKPLRDRLIEIANRHLLTDDDGLPYTDLSPLPAAPVADTPDVPQTEDPQTEDPYGNMMDAETSVERVLKDGDDNKTSEMSGKFETPAAPVTVAPSNDRDLWGGNSLASAAYTVGENAQLDARDRTDRGDSANYTRAPRKVSGFAKFNGGFLPGSPGLPPLTPEQRRKIDAARANASQHTTVTDAYNEMLLMSGLERLARAVNAAPDEGSRVESGPQRYWDPHAAGAAGGAWVDTPPPAAITPQRPERSRGGGRVRITAVKERVALLRGYALDGAARDEVRRLQRQATEATAVAKELTEKAREMTQWARLVKAGRALGIPEGELRRFKSQFDRQGMSIYKAFGLDDLLLGVLESADNEPGEAA
jgi:hypothetical protein